MVRTTSANTGFFCHIFITSFGDKHMEVKDGVTVIILLLLAETWHRTEIQGQDSFRRVHILLQSPLLDVGIHEYYAQPTPLC